MAWIRRTFASLPAPTTGILTTAALKDLGLQRIPVEKRWPLIWAYEPATWKAGEQTKGQALRDTVDYLRAVEYADRDAEVIRGAATDASAAPKLPTSRP